MVLPFKCARLSPMSSRTRPNATSAPFRLLKSYVVAHPRPLRTRYRIALFATVRYLSAYARRIFRKIDALLSAVVSLEIERPLFKREVTLLRKSSGIGTCCLTAFFRRLLKNVRFLLILRSAKKIGFYARKIE